MTPEDLDRILASEEPLVPSSGFTAFLMERVRESAAAPPPLPFPWRRFLLGLLSTLALSGICGWVLAELHAPEALGTELDRAFAALADPRLSLPLAEAGAALLGTYLLVRLALGITGEGR
jgi:hypothetical protein